MQNGTIGVTTENIFPIIKKFLYSDHEIFLRELVSNAVDATQKLKTLASIGEFKGELGDLTIRISLDTATRKLTISDAGVGMTAEEVDKYINQIAFSGAEEFMEKYKNQAIIGHFGLGFYSSFMVSDKVELLTRSFREPAETMLWTCTGSPQYTLEKSETARARGTDVVLHLSEDSIEFADETRIRTLLTKYCRFLPVPIAFGKKKEWKDGKWEQTDKDDIINETAPLWMSKPAEIKPEEYDEFYRKLYPSVDKPLFNIHLNIDYPFNLTGILYFPKIHNNFELQKNKIQLYSNQVFVTDSVEGIVPEFLTLLHGVIDSPDIPLNVSRSFLQSDSNVKKISSYITRKVCDRLAEIFNADRSEYETKWDDLKLFIQYGIITDEKFSEKATDFTLLKNTEGRYFTPAEYAGMVKDSQTDKNGSQIYLYTNDKEGMHSFIDAARNRGYDVLEMGGQLDGHFINWFENKNSGTSFVRVDSDVIDKLIQKNEQQSMALDTAQQELMRPVFEAQLPVDDKINYAIEFEPMDTAADPIVITRNEYMRRMKDMATMGGGGMSQFYGQMPDNYTISVNGNHPLVIDILDQVEKSYGEKLASVNKKIDAAQHAETMFVDDLKGKKEDELTIEQKDERDALTQKVADLRAERASRLREIGASNNLVKQLIDLALLSGGMLKGENLTKFIRRSVQLIGK